jgi:hypothetical protein
MAEQQQKMAKGGKNLPSVAEIAQNKARRPRKVAHSRMVHLSNALHCCKADFAEALRKFYAANPVPEKKRKHKRAKKF